MFAAPAASALGSEPARAHSSKGAALRAPQPGLGVRRVPLKPVGVLSAPEAPLSRTSFSSHSSVDVTGTFDFDSEPRTYYSLRGATSLLTTAVQSRVSSWWQTAKANDRWQLTGKVEGLLQLARSRSPEWLHSGAKMTDWLTATPRLSGWLPTRTFGLDFSWQGIRAAGLWGLVAGRGAAGAGAAPMAGRGSCDDDADAPCIAPAGSLPPVSPLSSADFVASVSHDALEEFLQAAAAQEIELASFLAFMSNLAYDVAHLNGHPYLQQRQLKLVTTSLACPLKPRFAGSPVAAADAEPELPSAADGASPPSTRHRTHMVLVPSSDDLASLGAGGGVLSSNIVPLSPGLAALASSGSVVHEGPLSPRARSAAGALAASSSAVVGSPRGYEVPIFQASVDEDGHFSMSPALVSSAQLAVEFDAAEPLMASPVRVARSPQRPSSPLSFTVMQPSPERKPLAATGSATAPPPPTSSSSSAAAAKAAQDAAECQAAAPTAWFVADDERHHVRYFCLQGSTNVDHWQINFQFDPVTFESPSLDAKIHRGIYETAQRMYDEIVPLVREHVSSHPQAKICLTGHSLGGSLSTVLMMMLVHRGVLGPARIAPMYTFGAPAVFSQGTTSSSSSAPVAGAAKRNARGGGGGGANRRPASLLRQLGLDESVITNVIMHRDIVPRAFVCDYTLVADLLVKWWPSFRGHPSLNNAHGPTKLLYHFVGRLSVLQPDDSLHFVNASDGRHELLPDGPGLYHMEEPQAPPPPALATMFDGGLTPPPPPQGEDPAAAAHGALLPSWLTGTLTDDDVDEHSNIATAAAAAAGLFAQMAGAGHAAPETCSSAVLAEAPAAGGGEAKLTLDEAVLVFMNRPHPLQTLADRNAYGANGTISRYHNPDNYAKALQVLLDTVSQRIRAPTARRHHLALWKSDI